MFEHIKDLVEADDSGPRAWKLLRDVIQPNTLPMVIVLEKELAAISMRPGDDVKPKLVKDGSLKGLEVKGEVKEIGSCPTCLETKFSKFPFNSTTGPAKTPLALVHMDVIEEDEIAHYYWAPIPEPKTREEALNGPNGEK
ncbi:hypothetical protein CLOM_g3054 [Closterium sp. NIES-68]|nr:hypothetical protein CLOM_g3054 [Closterium sp. NIES-68]